MHEKLKCGDIEIVRPDEKLVALTVTILEQNKMVLEMNSRLLDSLNNPHLIYAEVKKDGE